MFGINSMSKGSKSRPSRSRKLFNEAQQSCPFCGVIPEKFNANVLPPPPSRDTLSCDQIDRQTRRLLLISGSFSTFWSIALLWYLGFFSWGYSELAKNWLYFGPPCIVAFLSLLSAFLGLWARLYPRIAFASLKIAIRPALVLSFLAAAVGAFFWGVFIYAFFGLFFILAVGIWLLLMASHIVPWLIVYRSIYSRRA